MAEETQGTELTKGMLVMCRLGEKTVVGPCRVVYAGEDYVTVEDPGRKVWQTTPDRVDRADERLSHLLNS